MGVGSRNRIVFRRERKIRFKKKGKSREVLFPHERGEQQEAKKKKKGKARRAGKKTSEKGEKKSAQGGGGDMGGSLPGRPCPQGPKREGSFLLGPLLGEEGERAGGQVRRTCK